MSKIRTLATMSDSTGKLKDEAGKEVLAHAGGVATKTFGSASMVPIITVNRSGKIKGITTTAVAGVDDVTFNGTSGDLTVATSDGGSHVANIGTFVDSKITALIGDAPVALDSFKELADAINSDNTYYQTVNNLLSNKVATSTLTSGYYTKAEVNQLISDLVGDAPASMDTLSEIADILNNDLTRFYSQATVPVAPKIGDRWLDTSRDNIYLYINDGVQNLWIERS